MLGHANNSSKGGANSPSEVPPLPQYLSLNPISFGNQKHVCAGDIKRVLGLPLTNMLDGNSLGVSQPRPLHPAAPKELKNIKESVQSGSKKAKDRSNMFQDSIFKLEKYRENLSSRKRQRSANVSGEKSGTELEKPDAQLRGNPRDAMNQRQDQRPKNTVVVKRVRASIGEARVESKVQSVPRPPSLLERNEEKSQISNATSNRSEEKMHKVPGGGEVWAKKIKRKRSVTAMGNRLVNGDGESKQLLHTKVSTDSKLRSCDGQTFRSKNCFGVVGVNRVSSRTESPGSNTYTPLRDEPDVIHSPKDRMDMFEPWVSVKGSRINIREGDLANSPGLLIKGKFSRTSRAGSSAVADPPSSQSVPGGCSEDYELTSKVEKIPPVVIAGDKKGSLGSSSQPMAHWVGQRTHKKSRLRRANVVSPLLNPAEKTHNLSDSLGILDYSARNCNVENRGSLHDYCSSKNFSKVKKEIEKSPSPVGVLESDESGARENGLNENGVDGGEVSLATVSLNAGDFVPPGKKQKFSSHEHGGVRKHGRSGRGLSQLKIGTPPMREKMDDSPVANLPQTLRRVSDKVRSKSGRTSSGKSKDRSYVTRVGPMLNSSSSDCTGEFDDDRETLVAAASSARDGSNNAFCGPFWPKIRRIFGSVNVDDETVSFLKQQLHSMEEFDETIFLGANHNVLGNVSLKDHSGGTLQNHLDRGEDVSGKNALTSKVNLGKLDKATPLYERILSALIEDENEEVFLNGEGRVSSLQCMSDDSHCGSCNHIDGEFRDRDRDRVESEGESAVDIWNQKVGSLDKVYCDKSVTSCSLKSLSASAYSNDHSAVDDDYCHSDAGMASETCSNDVGHLQRKELSAIACSYSDSEYEKMSLDERLLLELRSIDLYPDVLPDLSEEGVMIHRNIMELRKGLTQKIEAKRDCLAKVEIALIDEVEVERRKLEETAMYKLMEMAYRKRMACRGGNSSKAAVRKVPKQVALAFIKRTLARCRKYQDTGISSFADPSLADILFSASMNAKSVDGVGSGTASNTFNDAANIQVEERGTGAAAASGIPEMCYSHGNNPGDVLVKPGTTFHKGRKKDMLIDDVGCASSKMAPIEGSTPPVGPKGKRGERQKNSNNPLNCKAKSKQNNNRHPSQRQGSRPELAIALGDPSNDPLDFTKMGLDGNQDLTTLLDFDMEGDQDLGAAGLEIPPWDDVGLEVPPWDDQFVFGL
ncbi:hypothetical protein MLD38_004080 [Melastoma candidum]|uniref:Uncharacterized protein n=2 Tax=Melastoma candidum TaxID=119954 RepID=A0ACB9S8F4_9MYRT|nr:hypothetical protein MLD38_004080 [Melastoma candidum]